MTTFILDHKFHKIIGIFFAKMFKNRHGKIPPNVILLEIFKNNNNNLQLLQMDKLSGFPDDWAKSYKHPSDVCQVQKAK